MSEVLHTLSIRESIETGVKLAVDPFKGLTQLQEEFGPTVQFQIGPKKITLVSNGEDVHSLMTAKPAVLSKDARDGTIFRSMFGDTLFGLAGGTKWIDHRQMMQPAFHRRYMDRTVGIVDEHTQKAFQSWRTAQRDTIVIDDFNTEMNLLTSKIITDILFGYKMSDEQAKEIGKDVQISLDFFSRSVRYAGLPWLMRNIPGTTGAAALKSIKRLRSFSHAILDSSSDDNGTLLPLLIDAHKKDGMNYTQQEVVDDILGLFIAGHETTSSSLAWGVYEIANNKSVESKVRQESSLQPLTVDQIKALTYTTAAFKETIRMHPPIWLLTRRALDNVQLPSGATLEKDSTVVISPYLQHMQKESWTDPTNFNPERSELSKPKAGTFIPFGLGPRSCIGASIAMTEGPFILNSLFNQFEVHTNQNVQPVIAATSRPQELRVILTPR